MRNYASEPPGLRPPAEAGRRELPLGPRKFLARLGCSAIMLCQERGVSPCLPKWSRKLCSVSFLLINVFQKLSALSRRSSGGKGFGCTTAKPSRVTRRRLGHSKPTRGLRGGPPPSLHAAGQEGGPVTNSPKCDLSGSPPPRACAHAAFQLS